MQSGPVESGPDQLAFSDKLAYMRHRGSPNVLMIPLDAVGEEGKQIPLVDFPGGQNPPGRMSRPCWATSMIQAPGASAMLVSNAVDQAVYYYKEGMAAPMGTFKTYSCEPLAVMVVDRSLRERTDAGSYRDRLEIARTEFVRRRLLPGYTSHHVLFPGRGPTESGIGEAEERGQDRYRASRR